MKKMRERAKREEFLQERAGEMKQTADLTAARLIKTYAEHFKLVNCLSDSDYLPLTRPLTEGFILNEKDRLVKNILESRAGAGKLVGTNGKSFEDIRSALETEI